ncbi:transglutaminase-like domain-containing protein [Mucilaginibacter sp. KACC 22063]|uniref:transglutaminase-like domain-containing protein n=1 Tax=Mucilaginibacter sp. KACC 22063 TaxID=3025666 RepID=UPI002365B9F2|nr:transglutaminase family protein [Mucilaginibacter sp. KACC 22063]WDF54225.1 transglutaminase family protein [Mucilaginibacter sp. KACC 22063]
MKFKVSAELGYDVKSASTLILNIHALKNGHQTILDEKLIIDPYIQAEEFVALNGDNRFVRVDIPNPGPVNIKYEATVDNCYQLRNFKKYDELAVNQFDPQVLTYLNPSRYCQSDKLYRLAKNTFGYIESNYDKVVAITNWVHTNVEYLGGFTNSETSAYDTVTQQAGVCRDFAHLGIALCRALTIPARYFTGYAYKLVPQDFHACFEAYVGGQWVLFDATKLAPLNGLVKIASARDAADAAIASIFGDVFCSYIKVNCELLDQEPFTPIYYPKSVYDGISYL